MNSRQDSVNRSLKGTRALLRCAAAALCSLSVLLVLVPSASAENFGLSFFEASYSSDCNTRAELRSGSHPCDLTTSLDAIIEEGLQGPAPSELLKDLNVVQIPGLAGDLTAVPQCATLDFLPPKATGGSANATHCADSTAVGVVTAAVTEAGKGEITFTAPVYNLQPAPGKVARLGFIIELVPVTIDIGVSEVPPYKLYAEVSNNTQVLEFLGADLTVWGVPADPSHDKERGYCFETGKACAAGVPPRAFLTMPRSCQGPLPTTWSADSWLHPGIRLANGEPDLSDPDWKTGFSLTHDEASPPNPEGMRECGRLGFSPAAAARPSTNSGSSPSGLELGIDVSDEGLKSPEGTAKADIEKIELVLPEGFTANPALAEGLSVCSEAQLAAETPKSAPGQGCPVASKIGTVEAESALLGDEVLKGSLYIATPYENPFNSLVAFYVVIKDPELGIVFRLPAEVRTDPDTGQLTTVLDDLPPYPISHVRTHLREGGRSPLATPSSCGAYDGHDTAHEPIRTILYPSSGGTPVTSASTFEIVSGPNGGPCPTGGLPPFHPNLVAGTENNAASAFSPFLVKLTRTDAEQEFTHFSIKLPPGVAGKLAGIPACSDIAIAQAAGRTGPHGGREELEDPSCPAASQVGRTLAGAGVGPNPAYAPGRIYLAGPYNGAPLSMVAITSGVVGPFDIGTVVVRLAVRVNPETGEVFLDSTGSDPIPHIIKGIPVHLRDIRAYTDRPEFTFNPTSCDPMSTSATVLGSGLDFASPADDNPFVSTSPFQAADCAALPFKPKLSFKLKGGTRRGANPSLRAHVAMSGFGEAAILSAQVTLPKSEFLEQAHIGTVCTRVQFNAGAVPGEGCPAASVYGKVEARTPILDQPLAGPIFLRSNGGERDLPDLVAALHGSQIDVSLVGFVDSGKNGGIRNTFAFVPDAPVSSADFTFFGGKKSLLSNSRNLCKSTNKVAVELKAHSGRQLSYKTPLKPLGCGGKKGKGKQGKSGAKKRR